MLSTGIILAGGNSKRMGTDKGLMKFNDKLMIQHVIDNLLKVTNQIIIISNNPKYSQFGYPVFSDVILDKGPLGGVLTGLIHSKTDLNFVVSCDTPFVEPTIFEVLEKNIDLNDVVYASYHKKMHPLIGVFHKKCESQLRQTVSNNNLKVMDFLSSVNSTAIDFSEMNINPLSFSNFNTSNDIKNFNESRC